jgi:hypothetical protein
MFENNEFIDYLVFRDDLDLVSAFESDFEVSDTFSLFLSFDLLQNTNAYYLFSSNSEFYLHKEAGDLFTEFQLKIYDLVTTVTLPQKTRQAISIKVVQNNVYIRTLDDDQYVFLGEVTTKNDDKFIIGAMNTLGHQPYKGKMYDIRFIQKDISDNEFNDYVDEIVYLKELDCTESYYCDDVFTCD